MNINEIYNPYDLALKTCEFIYPPSGQVYELQWKDKISPLFVKGQDNLFFINSNLKEGSIIFASNYFMTNFSAHFSNINVPFILVSAESDYSVPYADEYSKCESLLENPNLIKWFSVNVSLKHPKLIPIPIGIPKSIPFICKNGVTNIDYMGWYSNQDIENSKAIIYQAMNYSTDLSKNFLNDKPEFLYTRMTLENSDKSLHKFKGIRRKIITDLEKKGFVIQYDLIPFKQYYTELSKYKMCLSPPGAGLDCYRTWECMYLGVVPIVLRTEGMESLFENLPVILLSLEELENLTINKLYEEYINIIKKISTNKIQWEKLHLSYWIDLVKKEKINYILKKNSFYRLKLKILK